MAHCINIRSKEFKALQAETGLDMLTLKSKVGVWMEDNNTLDFPSVEQLSIKYQKSNEGEIKGFIDHLNNVIAVSRTGQTPTTIPHEYAHLYIKLFKDSWIVKDMLAKYNNDEELLVEAVAENVLELERIAKEDGQPTTELGRLFKEFISFVLNAFKANAVKGKNGKVLYYPTIEFTADSLLNNRDLSKIETVEDLTKIIGSKSIKTALMNSKNELVKQGAVNMLKARYKDYVDFVEMSDEEIKDYVENQRESEFKYKLVVDLGLNEQQFDESDEFKFKENKELYSSYDLVSDNGVTKRMSYKEATDWAKTLNENNKNYKFIVKPVSPGLHTIKIVKNDSRIIGVVSNERFERTAPLVFAMNEHAKELFRDLRDLILIREDNKGNTVLLLNGDVFNKFGLKNTIQYQKVANSIPTFERFAEVKEEIVKNLKNRKVSLEKTGLNNPKTMDMVASVEKLIRDIEKNEDASGIALFIVNASKELESTLNRLKTYNDKKELPSRVVLSQMLHDFIGFYEKNINLINDSLVYDSSQLESVSNDEYFTKLLTKEGITDTVEKYIKDILGTLGSEISAIKNNYRVLRLKAVKDIVKEYGSYLTDEELLTLNNELYVITNDTTGFFNAIGNPSDSKVDIIRLFSSIIKRAENSTDIRTLEAIADIRTMLNDMYGKGKGDIERLMEVNNGGVPTGRLVDELNYGQLQEDYDAEEKIWYAEANEELGLTGDEMIKVGEPIEDLKARRNMNIKKNEWLSNHVERMFKKKYYEAYAELSDEAVAARSNVDAEIVKIMAKYRKPGGGYAFEKLASADWRMLSFHRQKKAQLASTLDINGNLKVGTDLSIAEELSVLNEKLNENLIYEVDQEAFDLADAEAKKTMSKEDYAQWYFNNTKMSAAEEYFDALANLDFKKPKNTEEYNIALGKEAVAFKRRLVLKYFKDENGNIDYDSMTKETINAIQFLDNATEAQHEIVLKSLSPQQYDTVKKNLDEKIARVRKTKTVTKTITKEEQVTITKEEYDELNAVPALRNKIGEKDGKYYKTITRTAEESTVIEMVGDKFKDIAQVISTPEFAKKNLQMLRDSAKLREEQGSEVADKFEYDWKKENMNVKDGKFVRWSYQEMIQPKDEKLRKRLPNSRWNKIDKSSKLYNQNFREEKSKYGWQPKKSLYNNEKAYNKVMSDSDYKAFYELYVEKMKYANSLMFKRRERDPRILPQISGHTMEVFMNAQSIGSSISGLWKQSFYNRVDDDLSKKESDIITRADGTPVNFIPIKYVSRLDDNRLLTNDLGRALSMYLHGAINFDEKSKVLPELNLIKEHMQTLTSQIKGKYSTRVKGMGDANLNTNIANMMDIRVFNNKEQTSAEEGEFSVSKFMRFIQTLGRAALLALKPAVIAMNFLQGHIALAREFGNDYYIDKKSLIVSNKMLLQHGVGYISDIGKINKTNLISLLLEKNGIKSNITDISKDMRMHKVRRIWNKASVYFIHELTDAPMKAMATLAIYNSHKIYDGKVMMKNQFLNDPSVKGKVSKKEAIKIWDNLESVINAYETSNSKLVVKPAYRGIVTSEVENNIRNVMIKLHSRFDTLMTEEGKTKFMRNAFASMLFMLRSWFVTGQHDRWKSAGFDYNLNSVEEGFYRTGFRRTKETLSLLKKKNIIDMYGSDLSRLEAIKRHKNEREDFETLNMKRFRQELALIITFHIAAYVAAGYADDDDDDRDYQEVIAYLFRRLALEQGAYGNPADIFNIIKSPAATSTTIEDIVALGSNWDKLNKEVKRGHYNGFKEWQKKLIKLTPLRGPIEDRNIKVKRKYLEHNFIKPDNFLNWVLPDEYTND